MRHGGILIILLIAAVVGANLYVQLSWDYADAPPDVKQALLIGGLGMLGLALLGFPLLLRRGGRV
ncbi:hypothetical protein [Aeropyrum globular virus 1]|uniref:hypothetical protein n=1 Tax=Aeropyrum globular virus 1 TaxID=1932713 RepID=UPI000C7F2C86|nr:hypothetical protein C1186_gp09 [Aeropyrum globular virus 1]BBC20935.1 hypothetical protein [Aeropyrum globular virus 1]